MKRHYKSKHYLGSSLLIIQILYGLEALQFRI